MGQSFTEVATSVAVHEERLDQHDEAFKGLRVEFAELRHTVIDAAKLIAGAVLSGGAVLVVTVLVK